MAKNAAGNFEKRSLRNGAANTGYAYSCGGCAFWVRPQASAAATRREMLGCEWKNHSTHLEGVRSARFCSASLFIDEINGSTPAIDSKVYLSACRSLKRE